MWAGLDQQREQVRQAGLELAPGELLAAATGRGARLEEITTVLLLTDEDDFNGPAPIPHRIAPALRSGRGRGLSTEPRLPHPARVRQHPPLAMHGRVQGCCR